MLHPCSTGIYAGGGLAYLLKILYNNMCDKSVLEGRATMIREDFTYDSRDNATKIHAVVWKPDSVASPLAIVQLVHGMSEHVNRYTEFAEFLTSNNIVVYAEDHLGHGETCVGGKKGYFCKQDPATVVVRDVHRLKKIAEEQYPNVPYIILGSGMGSFILRNYLFRYGKGIDGAIIMATGVKSPLAVGTLKVLASAGCMFRGGTKEAGLIAKICLGSYSKRINNARTMFDWLTHDAKIVDKYMNDSMCGFTFPENGYKTLGELLARLNRKSNIEKMPVTLKILITSGEEDPVGDYGQAPQKLYKQYIDEGMQHVSIKLYPDDRHELLNELNRDKVYKDLLDWISDVAKC